MTKQVSRLMKKACTLKIASQLRDLTDYAAVRDNDTRWSSTYNMLKRFLNIKTELSAIVELLTLFPNHLEVDILSRACETMKKFDSVTIMLQRDGMTFVESREIFDLFVKDYPEFKHYIADDAAIVEDVVFERTIMKIARGLPLSEDERIAGLRLLQPDDTSLQGNDDASSREDAEDHLQGAESYSQALERKLKRQRRITESERSDCCYMNLNMLPGTSVDCERLFSAAKFILSDTWKRTSPTLFEALLLLKVNSSYWNVVSVSQAMMRSRNTIDEDNSNDNVDEADDLDSSPELASMSASSTSSNMLTESPSSVSISIPY